MITNNWLYFGRLDRCSLKATYNRYRHRFFDQVGHETMHASKALRKYEWPKMKRDVRQKCSLFRISLGL